MKLTIYRNSWARGDAQDNSLYNPTTHQQCCLGQIGSQCGVSLISMLDLGEPDQMYDEDQMKVLGVGLIIDDDEDGMLKQSRLSKEAIGVNDEAIPDEDRERKLAELFARRGHALEFVDGIAPWIGGAA